MTGPCVRSERRGPVATIILHRPERRNAVDRDTAERLSAAISTADEDPKVRVMVLWGAGGTFCAGADLKAFAQGAPNRLEPTGDGPMGPTRMRTDKPVIAAIAGHAVAGGLELALWADLRVAERGAIFGVFCRRWGVPLIDGGTQRLPQLIGHSRALDLLLTGRPLTASQALDWGLVNRVVPEGQARAAAEALALQIAAFPQECLRADLASARAGDGLEAEFQRGVAVLEHAQEGVARFVGGAGRHGEVE